MDVHPDPETALCDGPQALMGADLRALAQAVRQLPPALGRVDASTLGPHAHTVGDGLSRRDAGQCPETTFASTEAAVST